MSEPYRVLSWGGGLQSTLLGELSAQGELDRVDLIVHADPGWERARTYEIVDFYSARWRKMGMRVEILKTGNIEVQGADEHVHMPFWTEDGGPLLRQCTREFKIRPIRRFTREQLGYHPSDAPHPPVGAVESWLGFTTDEWTRAKPSSVKYIVNRWPLLEMYFDRDMCKQWFKDHDLPVPIKSACIGCPYRRAMEWLEMRQQNPEEFEAACQFDDHNRKNPLAERGASTADALYIYREDRVPLREAPIDRDGEIERRKFRFYQPMFGCDTGFCGT